MFTDKELLVLWANDQKRRKFVQNFKIWGVWFAQPELDLTFYKYDLPGSGRIIAMEYLREPYNSEKSDGDVEFVVNHKFYLQKGKYFNPSASSDFEIAERLKEIKATLQAEQKQHDRECKKCGGKVFGISRMGPSFAQPVHHLWRRREIFNEKTTFCRH